MLSLKKLFEDLILIKMISVLLTFALFCSYHSFSIPGISFKVSFFSNAKVFLSPLTNRRDCK